MSTIIQKNRAEEKRKAISLEQFFKLIPNEESARLYLEAKRWNDKPQCVSCGSGNVVACKDHKPLPYRCRACRKHFSVRVATVLGRSRTELQKWLMAVYMMTASGEGVPCVELARALGVTEETAGMMAQCIHDSWLSNPMGRRQYAMPLKKKGEVITAIDAGFDEVASKMVAFGLASEAPGGSLPVAKWSGRIELCGEVLDCHVFSEGQRVLSAQGVVKLMVDDDLATKPRDEAERFLEFVIPGQPRTSFGLTVDHFDLICRERVQRHSQERLRTAPLCKISTWCETVITSFTHVSLGRLIDEVTGHQYDRVKATLQSALRSTLAVKVRACAQAFPDELWKEFGTLAEGLGSLYSRPAWWDQLVAELLYETLDSGVARYLREGEPGTK